MARRSAEEAAISDRLNGQFEEAIAGHVTAAIMTFGGRMTKTSQEMFTCVARCPNCTDHGEKHMARHEWIVGQPETHRSDCEYCQRRDAITDGSVQLAMLKRIEKRARRVLKDVRRIADQLDPAEKQEIADRCAQVISTLKGVSEPTIWRALQ